MNRLARRLRPLLAAASVCLAFAALGCGSGGGGGGGGGCAQTKQEYECQNMACKCTAGPKKDQSCCHPEDKTCTDDKKCPKFCEYCAS